MKKVIVAATMLLFSFLGTAQAGNTIKVKVNGLVCDFCAQAIGIMLRRDPAVSASRINLNSKIVTIRLKNGKRMSNGRVNQLITAAGYNVVGIYR